METKIGILGCGSFALALAHLLSDQEKIYLWEHDPEKAELIRSTGRLEALPGYKIKKNTVISEHIINVVEKASVLFVAIPSAAVVQTLNVVKRHLDKQTMIVIASKGLDPETKSSLYESLRLKIPQSVSVLYGPTFSNDIIKDSPVTCVLAAKEKQVFVKVQELFPDDRFHLEYSDEPEGVSLCGAFKNVYAIGSGILKGLGFFESTNAWYLTKALNELQEVFRYYKIDPKVLCTAAGIGDLLLTGTSEKSRNFRFGEVVGKGIAPKHIDMTIEGKQTLMTLHAWLLLEPKLKIKIVPMLYDIVMRNRDPKNLLSVLR